MGAPDLLMNLAAIGVTVTVQAGNLIVQPWSRVPEHMRQALRAAKPALLGLLVPRPRRYRLKPAELKAAHLDPWDEVAINRFQARTGRLQRLGFDEQDADDMAERLHLRDARADDRHVCLECRHYRPGRCTKYQAAGLSSPEVGPDLAVLLQRCPGFGEETFI